MFLSSHEGLCCGIACIYGFNHWSGPTQVIPAYTPEQLMSMRTAFKQCQFPNNMPRETAHQRLRRYIQHRENTRSSGIIQAVLTTHQLPYWKKTLEGLHFKESCRNLNSNSNNTIVVFHRLSGAEGVDKIITI